MIFKHRTLISLVISALTVALLLSCAVNSNQQSLEWEVIWQDEFDGPAGSIPDSSKWGYDLGTGWGNRQLEYDTDEPRNASMDGAGNLAITAYSEFYEGCDYTSARIVTRDLFEPTYGKFEARIKMPSGQGMWPAFWLLGANIDSVGWPQCGEIDIMEYRGQEPNMIHGTIHGPGYSGSRGIGNSVHTGENRFDQQFHVFTVEWHPQKIQWFMDGVLYHTIRPRDLPGEWVYDHPFYIILNLAVGGNYVGSPDETTTFPQTLLVDYVRVYKTAN